MIQYIDLQTYRELLEERIAIMMFDAGVKSEQEADRLARADMAKSYRLISKTH